MESPQDKKVIKKVLFGVLNWGLGHATRSSVLIRFLIDQGVEVEIASDGLALALLKKEFPNLKYHTLKGYNVKYSSHKNLLALKLLCQLPKLKSAIASEQQKITELVAQNNYDLILSDNRYGFYSSSVKSILISHQLRLITPSVFKWVNNSLSKFQKNFDAVFVPDFKLEKDALSGELSHNNTSNNKTHFIGPLSQFSGLERKDIIADIDYLVLLSGPEPQRTILEQLLISKANNTKKNVVIVRGTNQPFESTSKFETYSLCYKSELFELLKRSKAVICRSGYSTLMDLHYLGLPAILIPTPGQTEQEYLGKINAEKPQFKVVNQEDLDASIFEWNPTKAYENKKSLGSTEAFKNALIQEGFTMPT